MRSIIFLFLGLSSCLNYSQSIQNDSILIYHIDYLPIWSQFTKTSSDNKYDNNEAYINTSINIYPKKIYCWDVKNIQVVCVMNKKLSKTKVNTDYLLKHEHGHFKITEIFTRKIRKYISEFDSIECDLNQLFQTITNFRKQNNEFNKLYDSCTDHSKNIEAQKKWDIKIDSILNVYKDFEKEIFLEDIEGS